MANTEIKELLQNLMIKNEMLKNRVREFSIQLEYNSIQLLLSL